MQWLALYYKTHSKSMPTRNLAQATGARSRRGSRRAGLRESPRAL
jgi:hypothetical protein